MLSKFVQMLLGWITRFASSFDRQPVARAKPRKAKPRKAKPRPRQSTPAAPNRTEPDADPEHPKEEGAQVEPSTEVEALAMPEPGREIPLESDQVTTGPLRTRQRQILDRIGERIERGQFNLPHLPSTSMVVMDLAANPSSEIPEIVQSLSTDPVLSTRLLRMANSALYATQEPVETLHEAIMRVGMRELRSLILALSMRQVIFRKGNLTSYAEETWRQAYSVAVICRSISEKCGMPSDKMFLLGLLHDVGKIALLSMLQKEIKEASDATPTLVGRAFLEYHESVGALMAEGWKLSDEFISVAGCHHDFESNKLYSRSAAVVSLAHRLDMNLSGGDAGIYWSETSYPEMEYLGLNPDAQRDVIETAHVAFTTNRDGEQGEAA